VKQHLRKQKQEHFNTEFLEDSGLHRFDKDLNSIAPDEEEGTNETHSNGTNQNQTSFEESSEIQQDNKELSFQESLPLPLDDTQDETNETHSTGTNQNQMSFEESSEIQQDDKGQSLNFEESSEIQQDDKNLDKTFEDEENVSNLNQQKVLKKQMKKKKLVVNTMRKDGLVETTKKSHSSWTPYVGFLVVSSLMTGYVFQNFNDSRRRRGVYGDSPHSPVTPHSSRPNSTHGSGHNSRHGSPTNRAA